MIIKEPFGFVFLKPGCESTAAAPEKRVKGELHTVPLLLLAWMAGQEHCGLLFEAGSLLWQAVSGIFSLS